MVPGLVNKAPVLLHMDSWEKSEATPWRRQFLGAAVYQAMQGPFRLAAQEMQSIASLSERVSHPPDAALHALVTSDAVSVTAQFS